MVPNHVGPKHPWAASQPAPNWLHGTTEHHLDTDYYYPPITDPHAVKANYVSALEGWFANVLPDLAQENPLVAQYLLQNALVVDGKRRSRRFSHRHFPYVPRAFWAYYHAGLFSHYPHFFTVGEIYNTDPTVTSYWAGGQTGFDGIDTHLTTPFDFPMNSAIRETVAHGASAKKIVDVLRQDRLYPHPELLVTFIGNHDMKRFLTDANGSHEKLKLAFSLLATLRGIPQLYYGDEIGMTGGDDPDNRHDFPGGFPGDQHNAFTQARTHAGRAGHLRPRARSVEASPGTRRVAHGSAEACSGSGQLLCVHARNRRRAATDRLSQPDTAENITLDFTDTSLADAKTLTPIFAAVARATRGHEVAPATGAQQSGDLPGAITKPWPLATTIRMSLGAGERLGLANGRFVQIVGYEGLAGAFAGHAGAHSFLSASAKTSSASSWAL